MTNRPLSLEGMVDQVRSFEPGGDESVAAAQANVVSRFEAASDGEAAADELVSTFERAVRSPVSWGAAAAIASSLVALKRRGGASAEDVDEAVAATEPTRRSFLLGALAAVATQSRPVLRRSQLESFQTPARSLSGLNVVVILIDDLNDYPTYLGGAPMAVHTPNLDALARESRAYLNHHVTVPICPASRATLMWGLSVDSHGQTRRQPGGVDVFGESTTAASIVQSARNAGVAVHGGGKVFHQRQFEEQWSSFLPTRTPTPINGPFGPDNTFFDYGLVLDDYQPDVKLRQYGARVLDEHRGTSPLLLMLGVRSPHLPWRVPQQYFDLYPIDDIVLPVTPEQDWDDLGPIGRAQLKQANPFSDAGWFEVVKESGKRAEHLQAYLADMSYADKIVGDVLNDVAAQPYADETVVVVISDNGYHQGENFAYRKLTLRNQSTRTPLIIRGPDFEPALVAEQVSSLDFAATVLDTLGVDAPVEGQSLRGDRELDGLVATHILNSGSLVFDGDDSSGRWTFHYDTDIPLEQAASGGAEVQEMEFYDHGKDPQEFTNLLADWEP